MSYTHKKPASLSCLSLDERIHDLKRYFENLGADIKSIKSPDGIENDLKEIVNVCDECFRADEPFVVNKILCNVITIMITIPMIDSEKMVLTFCEKLLTAPHISLARVCLNVLRYLMARIETTLPLRYEVYYYLIKLGRLCHQVDQVFEGIEILKVQFCLCPTLPIKQIQKIYRLLYDVLRDGNRELSDRIMIELLNTYTVENATDGREDAIKCIISALSDPNIFIFEPLLALKPISALKDELIYDLLEIFINERLSAYLEFHKENRVFCHLNHLNHIQNIRKMRLLTFLQLAGKTSVIYFQQFINELRIEEEDIEPILADAYRSKLIKSHLDKRNQKIYILNQMNKKISRRQPPVILKKLLTRTPNLNKVHG